MNDALTLKQIINMKHAIGLDAKKIKRGKYAAYRNYYTTNNDDPSWDFLVEMGLATKRPLGYGIGDKPQVYFVSRKGLELLEALMECKITESD